MTALAVAPPKRAHVSRHGWRGPTEHKPFPSLGWLWLDWTYAHLPSPADERKPLVYTDEQATRLIRWGELDPHTGEFVYLRMILEEAKGWGKSPFAGSLDLLDFAGPVCFDGWDANGEPVGVPWGTGERPPPWVQIAAVSEDQTENTYGAMYAMLAANDGRAADALKIDLGRTRLYLRDRPGRLEPVTASAGSREGQRLTKATADETQLWLPQNGGIRLIRTLRRNVAKMGGRMVETTNAPLLGVNSVAEQSSPEVVERGVLHYARRPRIEPDASWPDAKLRATLTDVYGEATRWVDVDRLIHEIRAQTTTWDDALRFWFNVRTAGASRAIDPRLWDSLAKPRDVPAMTAIGLGFDGSISRDATVLRGCTADGYSFIIGSWTRPKGAPPDWMIERAEVHAAVERAFATYNVGRFYFDPPKWISEGQGWQAQYGEEIVLPFDTNQRSKFALAVDRWRTALAEGKHTHDGDPLTTDHVKAARLLKVRVADLEDDGRTLYALVKGEDRRQIDAAVADVLAFEAATTMTVVENVEPFVIVRSW